MHLMLKVFAVIQILLVALFPGAHTLHRDDFPPHFVFGAATSASQVEGAAAEDGRTPSVFDTFAHNEFGDEFIGDPHVACDQYHKYKEDVQLMADMGLEAYRFSISWSRLIPGGRGPVNPKGVQYYNNLINELISHGIEPHVTMHHSDFPQVLEDEYEGWLSRRIVKDFTAYADVCFREFGDRVKHWTTLNEANVLAMAGYDRGDLPPKRCSPSKMKCSKGNSSTEPYLVTHNVLLAHASTSRLYRKKYQATQHGFVGINLLCFGLLPSSHSAEDIMATQRAQDFLVGWYMDPFTRGDYPEIIKKNAGSRLPSFTQEESNLVRGSLDFLGINFYLSFYVKDYPEILEKEDRDYLEDMAVANGGMAENDTLLSETAITPKILLTVLDSLKHAYGNIPIYIHENGQEAPNTLLNDQSRVNYLHAYIEGLVDEVRNGSNLKGYFVWSFMDVPEGPKGFGTTYGLYHVDVNDPNLRRIPKLSAKWYSNFLKGKHIPSKIKKIEKNASVLSNNPSQHNAT